MGSNGLHLRTLDDEDAEHVGYEAEKQLGLRCESGLKARRKLKPLHRTMLILYMEGHSIQEIAKRVGRSYINVWQIINDPQGLAWIARAMEMSKQELEVLQPKAVGVIRDALNHPSVDVQLKGLDRLIKLQEHLGIGEESNETAEDVVSRILRDINIQINVNT